MKRKILVIEDEDTVRETIQILLEDKGFNVSTSSTGSSIFSMIEKYNPDLILTDMFLGKADGRIICQDVKKNPKTSHIPIIIMSGNSEIYNTIQGVGANDVVLKPFTEQTLLKRVERQLSA
ncbi:MAG TPA: response regulator [Sphingobacteriaceae bacterium]|nr:response regulator [Sphingobacteriaceae bacterium]